MFRRMLNTSLPSHNNSHKFRKKIFEKFLSPLQNSTFQNPLYMSTNGLSNLLDKKILQKYFNFMKINTSHLKNVISQDDQQRNAMTLLFKKIELDKELSNIQSLKSNADTEMEKMVMEEEESVMNNIKVVENEFLDLIVPSGKYENNCEVELQVIPAIGGNEAKIFAEELHNMYLNYAIYKNWEVLLSEVRGSKFDLRSTYLLISGNLAMGHLMHEAGIHRVQRVPTTEKTGRTHTSTCCVSVLPKTSLDEIEIKPTEVIIDKVRSSGPGGQNVNKLETCIHLKHIPTGIRVECQTSRSQSQNLAEAFKKLKAVLRQNMENKVNSERKSATKEQVKSGDYSDKIRTYNFIQNRITDHRINFSMHDVKQFLLGNKHLDLMINRVAKFNKKEKLLQHIKKVFDSTEYKDFERRQSVNQ